MKDEKEDSKTLKLGKGKKKPDGEDAVETIKLKAVPKASEKAEIDEIVQQKKQKVKITEKADEKVDRDITVGKVAPFEFEPSEVPVSESSPESHSPEQSDEESKNKTKYKRPKAPKPQPETEETILKKGIPQKKEDVPEEDIALKYKQKPKPEEGIVDITLKPFQKPVKEDEITSEDLQSPTEPMDRPIRSDSDSETYIQTHKKITKIKKPHKDHASKERKLHNMRIPIDINETSEPRLTQLKYYMPLKFVSLHKSCITS